jgi:hypothetical protein
MFSLNIPKLRKTPDRHRERVTNSYWEGLCEQLPLHFVFDALLMSKDCTYIDHIPLISFSWEERYVSLNIQSIQHFVLSHSHHIVYLSRLNWLNSTPNMATATCLKITRIIQSLVDG